MQICIANLFLSESRWHLCKKSQVWFLVFNAPQLSCVPVTLPPPRNYMVFAIFLDLQGVRLQVPQNTYKERTRSSEFIFSPALLIHRKQSRYPETVSEDIPWQHLVCKYPSWSCAAGQEKGLFLWHLFWNIHQLRTPGIYFLHLPCVFVGSLPCFLPRWNSLGCVTMVLFHGVAFQEEQQSSQSWG